MFLIVVSLHALTLIGNAAAAAGNGAIAHTKPQNRTTEIIGICRFITFFLFKKIALADDVLDKSPIDASTD